MIFARKIYKIPEFYMIFAPKSAPILCNNCPKNMFSRILGGTYPPARRLLRLCGAEPESQAESVFLVSKLVCFVS